MKSVLVKRYILCVLGLFIAALGVAMTSRGGLGVSPVSSVPYIFSLKFPALTFGSWLIIWNCLLILCQIIVLRKNFKIFQLLQIPLSFLFGRFTDIGVCMVSGLDNSSYIYCLLMVIGGTVILGFGISITVAANVIMNSGEAFVKAVSETFNKDFGNTKIFFDISYVVSALILSLLFFDFQIKGTREGTVIAAVFTGLVIKFFLNLFKKIISKS